MSIVRPRALLDGGREHMPRMPSGRVLDRKRVVVRCLPHRQVLLRKCRKRMLAMPGRRVFSDGFERLHYLWHGQLHGWKLHGVFGLPRRHLVESDARLELCPVRDRTILGSHRSHGSSGVPVMPKRHVFRRGGGWIVPVVRLVPRWKVLDTGSHRMHGLRGQHVQRPVLRLVCRLPSVLGFAAWGWAVRVQARILREQDRPGMQRLHRGPVLIRGELEPVHVLPRWKVREHEPGDIRGRGVCGV